MIDRPENAVPALMRALPGVHKDYKAQSISKAMFSGEGLFTYKISGSGLLWVSTLGAIIRKDVCRIHLPISHACHGLD